MDIGRFKKRVRELTSRTRGVSMERMATQTDWRLGEVGANVL